MTVDDLNQSHQSPQDEANILPKNEFFAKVESPNDSSQTSSSKDEMISIEEESSIDQNVRRKSSEVHFPKDENSDESDQEECRKSFKTQHSTLSGRSYRLNHRTSFLSTHVFSSDEDEVDETDALPGQMSFTYLDAMALLFSVGTYIFDIVTDITVAILHYLNANYWYFALTVAFVTFPTIVMTSINLRWYIVDSREPNSPKVSKWRRFFRVLGLLFQFGPIMRYIDAISFGLMFRKYKETHGKKSRIARKHFQYMIYEDADATMLRMFECFLEAAPQLVLQMYIIAVGTGNYNEKTLIVQAISVNASLISLSWSLVSYLRILRMSLPTKINISWPGTIIQFFWRYFMIASRVVALSLFASIFTYYIGIVCLIHWAIMFAWIVSMKTNFCNNFCEELFYNAVLAIIFIFCYFNPVDSPTRRRYTLYYTFNFIESVILITLWYHACDPRHWYRFPGFVGFFVFFFIGLVFMIIYYLRLHPTNNIQLFSSGIAESARQPNVNELTTTAQQHPPVYSISHCNLENSPHQPNSSDASSSQPNSSNNRLSTNSLKYFRQFSDVWQTQNRLLHPRPTIPTI